MNQSAIFGPFFAVMLLTLAVWTYMYVRRIHFLQSNQIQPDQISTHSVVHCTFNHIMTRFGVYSVASLALWFMLVRAAWAHLGS